MEIALPTKPLDNINDPNGEIALCTLSAFNLGALNNLDELEELADLTDRTRNLMPCWIIKTIRLQQHAPQP